MIARMQTPESSRKVLVWDIPMRLFHWLFAATLSGALLIGLTADDHSRLFPWHMLLGLAACFLLLVRIVIGLTTRGPSSLSHLLQAPFQALSHISQLLSGKAKRHLGHNPLASCAYLLMFILLGLTILTGLNMHNEFAEEAHEVFAYGLLAVIIAHLAGIALHTLFFKENVALSMLHGKKQGPANEATRSARPVQGAIVLLASLLFIGKLFANYDSANQSVQIPLLGNTIHLGEGEGEEHEEHERHHDHHHDDDDDD